MTPPSRAITPPQVPFEAPVGIVQGRPVQQSAVVVHAPAAGTHAPRHLLFTQGLPQQSALVAHEVPAGIGAAQVVALRRQRGIPSESLRQQLSGFALQKAGLGAPFGSQQLFSEEHDEVLGLQMLPGSRHIVPLSQRPNSCVADALAHETGPSTGGGEPADPQQSLSVRQSSPVGEHPDGGSQMKNPPTLPLGAQTREQHVPPHEGAPASAVLQIAPLTSHCVAPGALATAPHEPSAAPAAFTQFPPQHAKLLAQTSPACAQKETASEQVPLLQSFEQHSLPPPQGLPDVLHDVLSGLQTPPPLPSGTHEPPQHSLLLPHARLSATHCLLAHWPPMHEKVQHSGPAAHAAPGSLQLPIGAVHTFPTQLAVQHSALVAQAWVAGLHTGASARDPSRMTSMVASSTPPASVSVVDSLWASPASPTIRLSSEPLPHPAKTCVTPATASNKTAANGSFFISRPPLLQARFDRARELYAATRRWCQDHIVRGRACCGRPSVDQ
jgi:hypothetical protein